MQRTSRYILILVALAIVLVSLAAYARYWWTSDWTPEAQGLRYRILDLGPSKQADRPENLLLGSSTLRWTPEPITACGDWFNRAIGAATSSNLLEYVRHAPEQHWRRVLLYTGDNDIAFGATATTALSQATKLVEAVRDRFTPDVILILPAKRSPARSQFAAAVTQYNLGMQTLAAGAADLIFLEHSLAWETGAAADFRKDGIHLSEQGNQRFFEPLRTYCLTSPAT